MGNLTERSKWCSRCWDIHSHGDCYFCGPCIHVHIGQTFCDISRLILGLHPANERRCYFVKTSLTDLDGCKPRISPVIALQNYSLLILLFIANMVLSQFTLPYLCGGKLQYFNVVDPMRVHIQCIVFHTIQDIFYWLSVCYHIDSIQRNDIFVSKQFNKYSPGSLFNFIKKIKMCPNVCIYLFYLVMNWPLIN